MATVLFVTWDGGGNLPPALAIGAQLRRRGDTIRFLGHAQQRTSVEAAGFRFEPYTHARPWSATAPANPAQVFGMFTDAGPGKDLLAAVADEPADLVVIDCMTLGALKAAHAADMRYVVLVHTFYEYLTRRRSGRHTHARKRGAAPLPAPHRDHADGVAGGGARRSRHHHAGTRARPAAGEHPSTPDARPVHGGGRCAGPRCGPRRAQVGHARADSRRHRRHARTRPAPAGRRPPRRPDPRPEWRVGRR